ncbi:ribosomal protein S18 acetylase RimI-like enzyme [Paraburkholderia sp. GAS41]|jgi:ribosomal protein S18 acetylase RimI-like enzyme|uniref:GNAT family N-acetyltransferase n=1 Tax=Paraburkholderia sp. GAS41 TaxID=3035134 RepID=UPI003D1A38EC
MSIDIREATIEDAEAIASVHVISWQSAYRGIMPEQFLAELSVEARSDRWRKSLLSGKLRVLVAYVDKAVVGWIAFGPCRDADKDSAWAELEALYVSPEFWSQGIGKSLSNSARQLLRLAGYAFVALWVLSENQRARGFYERIGFVHDDSSKVISIGGLLLTEIRYHSSLTS